MSINLPGSVWQPDLPFSSNITFHRSFHSSNTFKTFIAGTAVMAYPASCQRNYYTTYLVTNSILFSASVCVIIFIIGRLPLKNRICSWLLTVTMCVAIATLSHSYLRGVWLVNASFRNSYALEFTFTIAWYFVSNGGSDFSSLYCYTFPSFGGEASWVGSKKVVSLALWHLERFDHFNHNLNKD